MLQACGSGRQQLCPCLGACNVNTADSYDDNEKAHCAAIAVLRYVDSVSASSKGD
jgi:hypothetical protein